jgi:HAE1 family hydrophobic/amphiphilic exporter-1
MITLPALSIKRHVLAWMASAILVLLGIIGYSKMGLDRFPYIEFPIVTVMTVVKGATPEMIDASVTSTIESAVNSTPGIEHIQSNSSPNMSIVAVISISKKMWMLLLVKCKRK